MTRRPRQNHPKQATAMPVVDKKLTAAGQLAARLRCRCSSSISAT